MIFLILKIAFGIRNVRYWYACAYENSYEYYIGQNPFALGIIHSLWYR